MAWRPTPVRLHARGLPSRYQIEDPQLTGECKDTMVCLGRWTLRRTGIAPACRGVQHTGDPSRLHPGPSSRLIGEPSGYSERGTVPPSLEGLTLDAILGAR